MTKHQHEIRDPIHNFVRVTAELAPTCLVYPGATHRRFEHSLGVMELAGRVFDVITHERSRHPSANKRTILSEQVELGV